jgi:hypothetical protein
MSPNSNGLQNWPGQENDAAKPHNDTNSFAANNNPQPGRYPSAPSASERPGVTTPPPANPGFTPPTNTSGFDEELPAAQPGYSGAPTGGKRAFWTKRNKIIFGILTVVLVLLAAAAGTAWAYYNNPTKVLSDALSNAMNAETTQMKGSAKFSGTSNGTQAEVIVDYDMKATDKKALTNVALKVNVPPTSVDVSGSFITESQGDYYFKINDAKKIFQNLLGANPDSGDPSMQGINNLLNMVDSKWVKVSKADYQDMLGQDEQAAECSQKVIKDFSDNKQLSQQILDVYNQHPYVNTESLDSDDFNTLHYKLTFDEQKTKDFIIALKQTDLFKQLKACDDTFDIDEQAVANSNLKDINKANVEVWIGRWSHELSKVAVNGSENDLSYSVTMDTTFGQPVSIDTPQDVTPFNDIVKEIENIFGGSFDASQQQANSGSDSPDKLTATGDFESSVLGDRTFRWLPW